MRRKDKVIKEALQIYQQEKRETLPVYQEEERDSFEDRIYEKIRKMDIPNPRRKAHMVSLAIMVVFVVAIGIFFMQYRNKNRVSNTTKMIEKLYQQPFIEIEQIHYHLLNIKEYEKSFEIRY